MNKLKILIISEYITPVQSIASIRWTKIGKYLALAGHEVSVLTNEKLFDRDRGAGRLARYDETIAGDIDFFSEVYTFCLPWKLKALYWAWNERNSFKSKNGKEASARAQPNWKTATLKNSLMASAALAQYPDLASDFDVLISTYDPLWPHIVAAEYKKRSPDVFWVCDFRDQVYGSNYYVDQNAKDWASKVSIDADLITYISHTGKRDLNLPSGRDFCELTNGFDPATVTEPSSSYGPNGKFTVVYTGTLLDSRKRDLGAVAEALASLVDSGKIPSEDIDLLYAGMDEGIFRTAVKSVDKGFSRSLGLLSRAEAISLQANADVLLLLSWNTEEQQGVLTGKLYEYLASGRPICAWVQGDVPDSRVKKILNETGAGEAFEEAAGRQEQLSTMTDYLYGLYEQWKATGQTRRKRSDIDAYSHKGLADRIEKMIISGIEMKRQVKDE